MELNDNTYESKKRIGPTVYPAENNIIDDVNKNVNSHELRNTYPKLGSLTNDPNIGDIQVTDDGDEGTSAKRLIFVNRLRSCIGKSYADVLKNNIVKNKSGAALNRVSEQHFLETIL